MGDLPRCLGALEEKEVRKHPEGKRETPRRWCSPGNTEGRKESPCLEELEEEEGKVPVGM